MITRDKENKNKNFENLISEDISNNKEILSFIKKYFNLNSKETYLASTSSHVTIDDLNKKDIINIINLKQINDSRYINKLFEATNKKLSKNSLFLGCVLIDSSRRKKILSKYPVLINWLIYFFDTIFTRVFPKLLLTKRLYFYLTKGKGRVISKAETLGRLFSCGFHLVDEANFNNVYYFIVRKVKKPEYNNNPTYGMFISLKRVGKNNKIFNVYKLRTMHPYSEYLQEYVYKINKLDRGGKIKNDFRISEEGKFFRKYWIDELPMIYNWIKGDMKLVGVRPLSKHYFSLYPKKLQNLRTQYKPGLIPPFYADLPDTIDEIVDSEMRYLQLCAKSEFKTDIKYFYRAIKNILKGARSK